MWYLVTWPALIGASFFLLVTAYGSFAAHKAGKVRHQSAAVTDKRLEIMKEIITGIRLVKMYAWEWNFTDLVAKIRRLVSNILVSLRSRQRSVIIQKRIANVVYPSFLPLIKSSSNWHCCYTENIRKPTILAFLSLKSSIVDYQQLIATQLCSTGNLRVVLVLTFFHVIIRLHGVVRHR